MPIASACWQSINCSITCRVSAHNCTMKSITKKPHFYSPQYRQCGEFYSHSSEELTLNDKVLEALLWLHSYLHIVLQNTLLQFTIKCIKVNCSLTLRVTAAALIIKSFTDTLMSSEKRRTPLPLRCAYQTCVMTRFQ